MDTEVTDETILENYHDSEIDVEVHEFSPEEIAKAVEEIEALGEYDTDRSGE